MNHEEALTWDEYQQQKFNAVLGHAIMLSADAALSVEHVNFCIAELGKRLGEFASEQGYRPSEKAKVVIKFPMTLLQTCDPLNPHSTVGAKVECKLTATKDQYILYASKVIERLKEECKNQIEKSWQERLGEELDEHVREALGLDAIELYELDEDENPHREKVKKLRAQMEKLVDDFVDSLKK